MYDAMTPIFLNIKPSLCSCGSTPRVDYFESDETGRAVYGHKVVCSCGKRGLDFYDTPKGATIAWNSGHRS